MRTFRGSAPITLDTAFRLTLPEHADAARRVPLVVALHGFGESGERFLERLPGLEHAGLAVAWPDGPFPVEMREGNPPQPARIGYAWYQYTGDAAAFASALDFVGQHLDRLIAKWVGDHPIDPKRVVLLGYSQGGYLAAAHALAHPERFAGLVAIATRIKTELFSDAHLKTVRLPVLAIHGRRDSHIALDRQRESIERLSALGISATLFEHDGGHGLKPELVPRIEEFLRTLRGDVRA